MLYVKFEINDILKFNDFKKLYTYMDTVRQVGFEFEEENALDFDWDNMNDKEVEAAVDLITNFDDGKSLKLQRYKSIIPDYVNDFIEAYLLGRDKNTDAESFETSKLNIIEYIEISFEVDMDNLNTLDGNKGIVNLSTGNFPFGGMEQLLIILKAYDLKPVEYFDGFSIISMDWFTNFKYKTKPLPKQTNAYLAKE